MIYYDYWRLIGLYITSRNFYQSCPYTKFGSDLIITALIAHQNKLNNYTVLYSFDYTLTLLTSKYNKKNSGIWFNTSSKAKEMFSFSHLSFFIWSYVFAGFFFSSSLLFISSAPSTLSMVAAETLRRLFFQLDKFYRIDFRHL